VIHRIQYLFGRTLRQSGIWKDDTTLVEPSAENSSNKATTSALGLTEKTDGYPPLALILIAGGIAIAVIVAIFLRKDRIEALVRASTPTAAIKVPATELEGAQRPQQPEQDQQASPTSVSQASELIQDFERLKQVRDKGILTDVEFEQQKKRILGG
jgi:hypothetical protein